MKKVLIILFYWPPSGGSSVQRWLHFTNYLPGNGWEPVVYAPDNPQYPETDPTLESRIAPGMQVLKNPIFEPYNLYRKFAGIRKEKNLGAGMTIGEKQGAISRMKNNLSIWIRGNFFIPDARMFWIRPSVRYLETFLRKEKVDAIVTTGPPHSLHLVGYHLKKSTGLPWLADFRDPWTNIDFYAELKLTRLADKYHHRLEKKVLQKADKVIVVGEQMRKEFTEKGARDVSVISNGYDEVDLPKEKVAPDEKFSLLHIGTFSRTRNSEALWKALSDLVTDDKDFATDLEIKLVGKVDFSVFQRIREHGLEKHLNHIDYLTHPEAMRSVHSARVLLLLINNTKNSRGILTGKFFEYLTSGRPILLVGPKDGDAAGILEETRSGQAAGFEDAEAIKDIISTYYRRFKENDLRAEGTGIEEYSRKRLTTKLAEQLDQLIGQKQ